MALITTLRRADSLVDRMRAEMAVPSGPQPSMLHGQQQPSAPQGQQQQQLYAPQGQPQSYAPQGQPQSYAPQGQQQQQSYAPYSRQQPQAPPRRDLPEMVAARSWFEGKSVGVILLVLGALCVLAAGIIFIAVTWADLTIVIRGLILAVVTATFGLLAHLALRRGLQATAEAMAAITCAMFVLDLTAARRAGLPGLADLAAGPYEILAGVLLVAAAGTGAFAVRNQQRWLWSLDAAVALGMARAAAGAQRVSGDAYAVSTVAVTIAAALLYLGWRHLRFPVARWTAAYLGGMAWFAAVAIGAQHAANYVGDADIERVAQAWPALTVALVAGLWTIRPADALQRRAAACLSLVPALLVFEIVAWSHGWVVGASLMLGMYVLAALASAWAPDHWSPAVGGSALVLGLSAVVGLLPTLSALATRIGLAMVGDWRGTRGLPLDLWAGEVGPWLLPLTTLIVLALLPRITIGSYRPSLDLRDTAGAFVATLGVLPVLYGAGFWTSMTLLVLVAAILLCAARLWSRDSLLVLGVALLAVFRIAAYYDLLANPLAWTLIALALLALALSEHRPLVRAWFLVPAGLSALFAAAEWLTFAHAPRPYHGLVLVLIGSLGLLASQLSRAPAPKGVVSTRMIGEWLSVTWVVAGLAVADGSPSHRAVELTVAGVAAGITAYLSDDRRRAGWVSGVLLTIASWIRLVDYDLQAVEWYTVPAATALLVYGIRRLRQDASESTESSLRCLGPGLMLALTPSWLLALDQPVSWRGLFVGLASVALVALGARFRLAAPFAIGVAATALLALRHIWPLAAEIPRWTLLFIIGGALLGAGMTWESRVNNVVTAKWYVRGLR